MNEVKAYEEFTGKALEPDTRSYVISEEKAKIIDFAIKLGRPLLVEGEAGCGKTRLADAIADELELGKPLIIPIRSNSRANDLLYRYDALSRLQESQIESKQSNAKWAHNYVHLEPLGEAIREGKPCVILIDEVDKGDMDFPNDLLHVLDRFEFIIDEIPASESEQAMQHRQFGHTVSAPPLGLRPIVIFTSNREKSLPKPFLRRCIYLELTFPEDPKMLAEIVAINLRDRACGKGSNANILKNLSQGLIDKAVVSFLEIRELAAKNNTLKKPATAELIDWVHALHWHPEQESEVKSLTPPYWKLLFRSAEDIEVHEDTATSIHHSQTNKAR